MTPVSWDDDGLPSNTLRVVLLILILVLFWKKGC